MVQRMVRTTRWELHHFPQNQQTAQRKEPRMGTMTQMEFDHSLKQQESTGESGRSSWCICFVMFRLERQEIVWETNTHEIGERCGSLNFVKQIAWQAVVDANAWTWQTFCLSSTFYLGTLDLSKEKNHICLLLTGSQHAIQAGYEELSFV